MFEKALAEKFKRIFDLKTSLDLSKIKFSDVGYSGEQDCVFVEVTSSKNQIKTGREIAMITAVAKVFANADKLPFGYFSKRIAAAQPIDVNDIFFYNFEDNTNLFGPVVQRNFSFVYFFDSQYNPALGKIESVAVTVTTGETP